MSRFTDTEPVAVILGPCECDGTPHDEDIVYLAPALSMSGGMAAQGAISDADNDAMRLQELLAVVWVRHGVIDWNLMENGAKVPLTEANIARALPYGKGGRMVAERADALYAEDILAPLVERLKVISAPGRTNGSTSHTRKSTRKRPSPSSIATTDKAPPAG